jgi:methylase of polypeptide subunit release factors
MEKFFFVCLFVCLFDDIRTGSGCVITYLGQLLQSIGKYSYLLGLDINMHALNASQRTAKSNNVIEVQYHIISLMTTNN